MDSTSDYPWLNRFLLTIFRIEFVDHFHDFRFISGIETDNAVRDWFFLANITYLIYMLIMEFQILV